VQSTVIDKNKLSDTYIDLAIEYQQHNAPQVALERANLAVSTKDDNPKAYMIRAMIYQQLGQYDKAEQDFKKALWLDNKYSEDNVNYAVFLCDQKRYSEAIYNFNQALDNPLYYTPEIGYYSRGNCYAKQDSFESANRDYLAALNYKSPPQDTYIALFSHQNYQLANYYLNRYSSSQTPETMWLHIQILQAMIDQGVSTAKYREYNSYRKTLGQLLIKNYGDTKEAQQYLLQYDASGAPLPSRKKALPEATSAVLSDSAAQSVTLFESPSEAVKANRKINPSANDAPAVIVVKSAPAASQVPTPSNTVAVTTNNNSAAVSNSTNVATPASSASTGALGSSAVVSSSSASRRSITVNPGDTLYSISRKYSVPVATLQKINNIGSRGILSGMKLYLDPQ
jgi:type IV pilus assembly protein PilF